MILVNSQDPDQVAFLTLEAISPDVQYIYMTVDVWDGKQFLYQKGHIRRAVPSQSVSTIDGRSCQGFCAGTIFGYGFPTDTGMWFPRADVPQSEGFSLSIGGAALLAYCLAANGQPYFLSGFNYAPYDWSPPGLPAVNYTAKPSSLPDGLKTQGAVKVPYFQNYIFGKTGIGGNPDQLVAVYDDPSNYMVRLFACIYSTERSITVTLNIQLIFHFLSLSGQQRYSIRDETAGKNFGVNDDAFVDCCYCCRLLCCFLITNALTFSCLD
jgi:hypothetical protein